jgi:hypothetical protein
MNLNGMFLFIAPGNVSAKSRNDINLLVIRVTTEQENQIKVVYF